MSSLLSLREFDRNVLMSVVTTALDVKHSPEKYRTALSGKGLMLLMQKTSTRTVLAFTAAIHQLGGYALRVNWQESNFSISPLALEARYVGTTVDAVMARLLRHRDVAELAANAGVPVINGCDEKYHPSQAVADCLTVFENARRFDGVRVTYVGVHNNVTNSLLVGCTRLGTGVNLVTPIVNEAAVDGELMGEVQATGLVRRYDTVEEAVADSDFVYTDTWIDMEHFNDPGYQEEKQRRIALMMPFQLNARTVGDRDLKIMHDMPVHPGFEISAELVDDLRSVIFQQAENRLHAAKAILLHLFDGAG
jgi:ornithine carbamoyltransferase